MSPTRCVVWLYNVQTRTPTSLCMVFLAMNMFTRTSYTHPRISMRAPVASLSSASTSTNPTARLDVIPFDVIPLNVTPKRCTQKGHGGTLTIVLHRMTA